MVPASSKEFLDIQANYRVWIHSEARTWHYNNILPVAKTSKTEKVNINIKF